MAALSCSCSPQPSLYVSNGLQMPFLRDQGDIRASLAGESAINSTGGGANTFNIQAAYALTSQFGFIGSLLYSGTGGDTTYSKNLFGEIGFGYHEMFDAYGHFEIFGGFGYGSVNNVWSSSSAKAEFFGPPPDSNVFSKYHQSAKYLRPFVQMDFGAEGTVAAIGIGLRIGFVNVPTETEVQTTLHGFAFDPSTQMYLYAIGPTTTTTGSASAFFIEPSLVARIGYDPLKVYFQWTHPGILGIHSPFIYSDIGVLSIGIVARVQTLFSKNDENK